MPPVVFVRVARSNARAAEGPARRDRDPGVRWAVESQASKVPLRAATSQRRGDIARRNQRPSARRWTVPPQKMVTPRADGGPLFSCVGQMGPLHFRRIIGWTFGRPCLSNPTADVW